MNKTEAIAILNVTAAASAEDIRRAYQELFSEYQFRLTNAPTSSLKTLYQGRVRELEDARTALLGAEPEQAIDLPTSEPTYRTPAGGAAGSSTPAAAQPRYTPVSVPQYTTAPHPVPPPAGEKRDPPPTAFPPKRDQPPRKLITIGAGVAALALVAFFMTRGGKQSESAAPPENAAASAARSTAVAMDTVSPAPSAVRGDVSIAKMEFARADYMAGSAALDSADVHLKAISENPSTKPAIDHLRGSIAEMRDKIKAACHAERAVADRHGADLPKCP